jgi:hypothetical protein
VPVPQIGLVSLTACSFEGAVVELLWGQLHSLRDECKLAPKICMSLPRCGYAFPTAVLQVGCWVGVSLVWFFALKARLLASAFLRGCQGMLCLQCWGAAF